MHTFLFKRLFTRKRIRQLFLLGTACVLATLAANLLTTHKYRAKIVALQHAPEADCVMVLGAMVYDLDSPSRILQHRIETGIALYASGATDRLLMSGDHGRAHYDEVATMKTLALKRGVPPAHVFMDHAGFSTYDSMYRAKEIFGVTRMIVVTQEYHLHRALYIANELGIDAYGVIAPEPPTRVGRRYRMVREIAARTKDVAKTFFRPRSKFLGTKIPIHSDGSATDDGRYDFAVKNPDAG